MSSKKIHIIDNIENENVKIETMENGNCNKYTTNIFTDADDDLINYDDSKIVCCGLKRNLFIKRLFLPAFPGGITVLFFYENIRRSFYLFPIIVFGCSLILFMNFPILVVHSSLKPTYFGKDLFIDSGRLPYLHLTIKEKKDFLIKIKWLLILLYSALSAALSDYWLFKTQNTTSYFEVLGVTGGILKLFQLVTTIAGGYFLSKTRKNALKRSRKNSGDDSSIELIEINLKHNTDDNIDE